MEDEAETFNTDSIIRRLGGCGRFQALNTALAYLPFIGSVYSIMFMVFGAYNPGWRCLDADIATTSTTNTTILTTTVMRTTIATPGTGLDSSTTANNNLSSPLPGFQTDTCWGYDTCKNVQFSPDASTITTEWGLVCDKAWIASAIISIQMAGLVLGCLFSGYLGDTFGRKSMLCLASIVLGALNILSVFSVSWEQFAAIRFFIGMSASIPYNLSCVFVLEFVPPKWRVIVDSLPMWAAGSVLLTALAVLVLDWKILHLIVGVTCLVSSLIYFVIPESIRWLKVKGKKKEYLKAIAFITKINNRETLSDRFLEVDDAAENKKENDEKKKKPVISPLLLFTRKETRAYAIALGYLAFTVDFVYFAVSFGISGLPGNIFVNLLVIFSLEFIGNGIAWFAPNACGRKPSGIFACVAQSTCLFIVVGFDLLAEGDAKRYGILVFIVLAKAFVILHWYILQTLGMELFPTEIRSTAAGYIKTTASIGGMVAPYLIPSESNVLYISYVIMAVLCLVDALVMLVIPETTGQDLQDQMVVVGVGEGKGKGKGKRNGDGDVMLSLSSKDHQNYLHPSYSPLAENV